MIKHPNRAADTICGATAVGILSRMTFDPVGAHSIAGSQP